MLNPTVVPADAKASPASAPTRPVFGQASFSRTAEAHEAGVLTGRPTRASKHGPARVSADKIVQAFNTWAFKREQPDTPELLTRAVARHLELARPLSFVLYWGKGPRDAIGAPDLSCLGYLEALRERVRGVYQPGASFKLIFTDTHAGLNGHSVSRMNDYFGAVEIAARERGFKACRLGELVRAARAAGISPDDSAAMTEETQARLRGCAAKWFRGEGSAEQAAAAYYEMNMMEKRAVEYAFPNSIFVTFNGSEYRDLFPAQMPIFYMYSVRRGVAVKPWFMPDGAGTEGVALSHSPAA